MSFHQKSLAALLLGALLCGCQSHKQPAHKSFHYATAQTMNPVTRNLEQEPPFGPRSNKAE